ncbi:MAG: hypothetical protein J6A28_04705 [Clostridia bacterium]|nr:hypothetical protein [Clostridia bacterium]
MRGLIKIESDVFFIVQRLKEVDSSYEVYYNLHAKSFEVHSTEQHKSSYCFKVPFERLDSRTIDYAKKTRAENRDKLIAEIERNNLLLYEKKLRENVEILKEML